MINDKEYGELYKILKENTPLDDETINKIIENVSREVLVKTKIKKDEFNEIINRSLIRIRHLKKFKDEQKDDHFINTKWRDLLFEKIEKIDKKTLKNVFVYSYLIAREKEKERKKKRKEERRKGYKWKKRYRSR
ncbi:hypothetical protein GFS03_04885 [Sulfolobus sp. E5-1-F]|uniref:hypothetical protein n=1 Tax=Saccharolobus sp. E5-1-F TaxID=2663019 RepID=UPI00129711F4|nr:hypothetical protein [Sulfolobus sp. E5-1-F]QGA53959.1 hypothetical protein GFS03_04885 [Sulfolobus sp. E5-1-F]